MRELTLDGAADIGRKPAALAEAEPLTSPGALVRFGSSSAATVVGPRER